MNLYSSAPYIHTIPSFWRARENTVQRQPLCQSQMMSLQIQALSRFTQVARLSRSLSCTRPLSFDRHSKTQQHNDEPYYFIGAKWSLVVKAPLLLSFALERDKTTCCGSSSLFFKSDTLEFYCVWMIAPANEWHQHRESREFCWKNALGREQRGCRTTFVATRRALVRLCMSFRTLHRTL